MFVIIKDFCDYRERGNTWIDGVEIEYFKNSPSQIRQYFQDEPDSPHTAHMLSNGHLRYEAGDDLSILVAEAQLNVTRGPNLVSEVQKELFKYHIDDLMKDMEDCVVNDNHIAGSLVRGQLIEYLIDVFFKLHGKWRPKQKQLVPILAKVDNNFLSILHQSISSGWSNLQSIQHLTQVIEKLLGGRRSQEWFLKSNLSS